MTEATEKEVLRFDKGEVYDFSDIADGIQCVKSNGFVISRFSSTKIKEFRKVMDFMGIVDTDTNYISYGPRQEKDSSYIDGHVYCGLADLRVQQRVKEAHYYTDPKWSPTYIIAISNLSDTTFMLAHNKYIERALYDNICKDGRWEIENKTAPNGEPKITALLKAELDAKYIPEIIRIISKDFHIDLFDETSEKVYRKNSADFFYVASANEDCNMFTGKRFKGREEFKYAAKLYRTADNHFVLLEGQYVHKVDSQQFHYSVQQLLIQKDILVPCEDNPQLLITTRDVMLGNVPSVIARFVRGKESEGPKLIKHFNTGLCLDEWNRKYAKIARVVVTRSKDDSKGKKSKRLIQDDLDDVDIMSVIDEPDEPEEITEEQIQQKEETTDSNMFADLEENLAEDLEIQADEEVDEKIEDLGNTLDQETIEKKDE